MYSNFKMDKNDIYHHGILGQKWGVRRFQNKDGSLTAAGRKRIGNKEDNAEYKYNKAGESGWVGAKRALAANKGTVKKVATIAGTAAAVGLAAYGISNPKAREAALKLAGKSLKAIKDTATKPEVQEFVKTNGAKAVKSLSDSTAKAGKAMTDAALVSIGTIQISKLAKKLETNENDSESVRDRNKILLDTATAGISSITKANSGSSNNSGKSNSGGNVGKEVSNRLGEPSKKGIDKNSSEYQSLFKDSNGNQRDQEVRSTIKSLASAGYDINQIQQYVNDVDRGIIKHGMDDYALMATYYIGKNYVASMMKREVM